MALAYQDEGIWDPVTDSYSAYPWESVSNYAGGWSQTAQDISRVLASTWAQKTLLQQNAQGQQYLEGQRIAAEIAKAQLGAQTFLSPQMLLLIGGGVLVYMLVKD